MGLDMYLYKKIYIGANYPHNNINGEIKIRKGDEPIDVSLSRVDCISECQAYWRKANQIHKWFVDNVQEGEDDCKPYEVSGERLLELVDRCKKVNDNHELAEELLPTCEGFFFGSCAYDDDYFETIEDTIDQLKDIDVDGWYEYRASW